MSQFHMIVDNTNYCHVKNLFLCDSDFSFSLHDFNWSPGMIKSRTHRSEHNYFKMIGDIMATLEHNGIITCPEIV
jgi:hypothetical protein